MITHDLGVVADIADEIVVMYAGRVVERADEARALLRPAASVHVGPARLDPAARPAEAGAAALDHGRAAVADQPAAGLQVPAALPARVREVHGGAAAREPRRDARPPRPLLARRRGEARPCATRRSRGESRRRRERERRRRCSRSGTSRSTSRSGRGCSSARSRACTRSTTSRFAVREGETLGLVGESGCGKSTLGRTIVRLLEPTDGRDPLRGAADREARRRASCGRCGARCRWSSRIRTRRLNPRKRVGSIIGDPLKIHGIGDKTAAEGAGPGAARDGRPLAGALQPLPARVLGRPAAADRRRARARAAAEARRRRRAGVGARRLDPGADAQPARGAPERVPADLHLHRARPRGRAARERPDRGHVPRQARRALAGRGALHAADHAVHRGAPLGGADPGSRPRREQRERIVLEGDVPSPINPPTRLPLPSALPVRDRRSAARSSRRSSTTGTATWRPATTR